jgi:hypothetical protein
LLFGVCFGASLCPWLWGCPLPLASKLADHASLLATRAPPERVVLIWSWGELVHSLRQPSGTRWSAIC